MRHPRGHDQRSADAATQAPEQETSCKTRLIDGHAFRVLTVIDQFTREFNTRSRTTLDVRSPADRLTETGTPTD